jgi:ATP-dependent helicase HrpB
MQITRDLAGFWRGSYAEVRKEMRGRYPRHYWPENPLEAEPRRGVRPDRR